jgi:hypothetical protein
MFGAPSVGARLPLPLRTDDAAQLPLLRYPRPKRVTTCEELFDLLKAPLPGCWNGRQIALRIYGATLGVGEVVGSVVVGVATPVSSVGVAVASGSVG